MTNTDKVELRGFVDGKIVQVIDAYCMATGKHRMDIIEPVLKDWMEMEIHKSNLVLNIANSQGIVSETKRNRRFNDLGSDE